MKRIPLILTLGSLLLIAVSFILYQTFYNKKPTLVWDIIPEESILVYEAGDCDECVAKISESVIGRLIYSFADFPTDDSLKRAFDFLLPLRKGGFVSVHIINKEDFDFVYYYPSDQAQRNKFENQLESLKSNKGVRLTERILNTVRIQEFDFGDRKFSTTQLDGIWVGSFTSFLIEDVIRTYSSKDQSLFVKSISEVYGLPRVKNDPGNIYIQLNAFVKGLEIFNDSPLADMIKIGQASLLDIKKDDTSLTLNGFSRTRKNYPKALLSYFERQTPVQFTLKQFFSNKTAFAVNYGISDGIVFYNEVLSAKNKTNYDSLSSIVKIDYQKLFSSFGDELAVCYQESKEGFSKVILFEISKPNEWLQVFDQLSKTVEMEDTVFYEKYSSYEIREIEVSNLPEKLFGPLASGFKQTYYTSVGNTILLAEDLEQIKGFVNDIDQEDVWSKSVRINKFLESTLLESNISFYINTPLVWSTLHNSLNPKWKRFISENRSVIDELDLLAIQFSHLNEGFYTNVALNYSSDADGKKNRVGKSGKLLTNFTETLTGKPFIVRSHVSKSDEILVQDSTNTIHHINGDGKVLWSKAIDGPIIGEVTQVDFFKNGKLQFFFTTSKKIYVVDRLGNYVSPFPAEVRTPEIEFATVIDYDNSKNYRFLVTDKTGKVWMFDKGMQSLEGWKPKNLEGSLYAKAAHHRVRGKDYLISIREDGNVFLMNRRGDRIKGFPLNLEIRPDGEYYLENGNSVSTTYFTCVSRDGFRVKFNLEGKILSKETLIKPMFDTQFSLIAERNSKSYLIKRQDAKQLALLDEAGKEILVNEYIGMNPVKILYYDFGAGRSFISITDEIQKLTFIYDATGKLITQTPIDGEFVELRPGLHEMPKLFIVNGKSLTIQE